MKKLLMLVLVAGVCAFGLAACGGDDDEGYSSVEESAEEKIQRIAEEYIIYLVENAGFHAPTSARVLRAGYDSAENGNRSAIIFESTGIFYFTIQANTLGGGQRTGDSVILYGGPQDKEIMSNDEPGNDYDSMQFLLDVARLNAALREHWQSLGVID